MNTLFFPYYQPDFSSFLKMLHRESTPKPVLFEFLIDDKITRKYSEISKDAPQGSFEYAIYCVEDAYDSWHEDIAILGCIDVDFLCQKTPKEIESRAYKLLEKTFNSGGYALGSGNSIPHYIPEENNLAILKSAIRFSNNLK